MPDDWRVARYDPARREPEPQGWYDISDYNRPPPPPPKPQLPPRLPATFELRPYQLEGAQRLLDSERNLNGDDAGLGKTAQAAAAAIKPVLVVCPTYLVWQWAEYIEAAYPGDTIAVAAFGSRKQRHKALTGSENLATLVDRPAADWTIVNTDMLRGYMMPNVETVILDEAHHFRNADAERSKNCVDLATRTPRVYQLTATPIYKDVSNFYNLLHMLDPDKYTSYNEFIQRVAITYSERYAIKIARIRDPKALERELGPYMLRRTYKDVGLFLPPIIENHLVIELSDEVRKMYNNLRDFYRTPEGVPLTSAAEVLHMLRHATVGPKMEVIPKILDDNPGPTVVFCWYVETSEIVAEYLRTEFKRPGDPLVIHGDKIRAEDRADAAHAAIAKGGIVVATMASLGEGVDLSAAKNVCFIEEDYVPGRMYQTLKRVQRWTEDERPVLAHYIRARGTVDAIVHKTVTTRKGDAASILKDALE